MRFEEKVLGYFDKAYLINLDRRKDRLDTSIQNLSKIGIQFERFPAIIFDQPIRSIYGFDIPKDLLGKYGCLMSHLKIIEMALRDNLSNVLIIEDDVKYDDEFLHITNNAIKELREKEWDMLFFWGCEAGIPEIEYVYRLKRTPWKTHFYAINSCFFKYLIHLIRSAGGPSWFYPIDAIYHSFVKGNIFCTKKEVVFQIDVNDSDITKG